MAKKSTEIVPTMLRIREDLRKRLEREAKKTGQSLNAEMAARLERSFDVETQAARDAGIIDMLVKHDDASARFLRDIADEIAKRPDWSTDETHRQELLRKIAFAAYGNEAKSFAENAPIFEPGENPTTPRKADQ